MHICVCIQFTPSITFPTLFLFLPHFSFLRSLCFQKQVLRESMDVSVHGCGFIYMSMARLLESAALKISDLAASHSSHPLPVIGVHVPLSLSS